MSNVLFPSPPAYDESAHLPVYDDVVIANRLRQLEKRLQKHIADVLKHNDVAVTEKAQKMVENILLIYEKLFDDLGEKVHKKMDAFKDWSTRLGTGEQTLIEMDKKIAKIYDKVTELDAFHAVIKRHEEREKKIHSDLLQRIRALEEREEKNHDVLIDEGIMRHIEKMVETRIGRAGAESGVDIDIDGLFDDSKLTSEDIEKIEVLKTRKPNIDISDGVTNGLSYYDKPLIDYMEKNEEFVCITIGRIIITDKNVYIVNTFYGRIHQRDDLVCVLYTFKNRLNYYLIKYLIDFFFKKSDSERLGNFRDTLTSFIIRPNHRSVVSLGDRLFEKFEQVIRLIPGSYQNGNWVALGGFFGMYFNTKTLELSEGPPPMPI